MPPDLFAIERYDDSSGARPAEPLPALPPGTRLACAVHLPADDAVLALVEGADEASVRTALADSGWRVDRMTAGAWIAPPVFAGHLDEEPS